MGTMMIMQLLNLAKLTLEQWGLWRDDADAIRGGGIPRRQRPPERVKISEKHLSFAKFSLVSLLTIAVFCSPALGASHGVPVTPNGTVQLNGFEVIGQSFAFRNFPKNGTGWNTTVGCNFPGILDVNGYPTVTPPCILNMQFVVPNSSTYSGKYIIEQIGVGSWGPIRFDLPGSATWTVDPGAVGVTANSGQSLTMSGANAKAIVTLVNLPNISNGNTIGMNFLTSAGTYTTPNIAFVRQDQEVGMLAGDQFNPEFISAIKAINPVAIRTMDWSSVNSAVWSQFSYRPPVTALSYRLPRWQPGAWAGGSGANGNVTTGGSGVSYAASLPTDWSILATGVVLQGKIIDTATGSIAVTGAASNGGAIQLTTNTTGLATNQKIGFASSGGAGNGSGIWAITVDDGTHLTLQNSIFSSNITGCISINTLAVGATAAKIIGTSDGGVFNSACTSRITANDISTFTLDTISDCWRYVPRGLGDSSGNGSVPVEIRVALANALVANYWNTMQLWYTDTSMQNEINYIRDNLNSNLIALFEYSNEVWNPSVATNFAYASQLAQSLGFPVNHSQRYSFYSLQSRRMFGFVESSFQAVGKTNYKRVFASQLYGDSSNGGEIQTYGYNSADLAPSGTHTGTGNSIYNTFTGNADYTIVGQRAEDHSDIFAYAPYTNGAQLASPLNGQNWASSVTTGGPAGWTTGLVGAADAYAAGGSTDIDNAFAFVDWDLTQGTINGGAPVSGNQTLAGVVPKYTSYENRAASYDTARLTLTDPRTGVAPLPPLVIYQYEGAISPAVPSSADCTTMGIDPTTYCGSAALPNSRIYNLLLNYKLSSNFQAVTKQSFDSFRSFAHSANGWPSWYGTAGVSPSTSTSIWSLFEGSVYTQMYTSGNAIQIYH